MFPIAGYAIHLGSRGVNGVQRLPIQKLTLIQIAAFILTSEPFQFAYSNFNATYARRSSHKNIRHVFYLISGHFELVKTPIKVQT